MVFQKKHQGASVCADRGFCFEGTPMYLLTIHLTVIEQRLQNGVLRTIILFCRLLYLKSSLEGVSAAALLGLPFPLSAPCCEDLKIKPL